MTTSQQPALTVREYELPDIPDASLPAVLLEAGSEAEVRFADHSGVFLGLGSIRESGDGGYVGRVQVEIGNYEPGQPSIQWMGKHVHFKPEHVLRLRRKTLA